MMRPRFLRQPGVLAALATLATTTVPLHAATPATSAEAPPDPGEPPTGFAVVEPIGDTTTTPPQLPQWTATASLGTGARDGAPDGTWQALALTRQLGPAYVRGSLMRYHGTLLQADAALPSNYLVGTVAAGGNFSGWVADGWVSYGWQDYGLIRTTTGDRASTGSGGSGYYAIGGDIGKVLSPGSDWYVTPTIAGSFAYGRLLRPFPADSGIPDQETGEPTWSAAGTIRIDRAFGRHKAHYLGLSLSRNWTSNALSTVEFVDGRDAAFTIDSRHYADGWFEVGATSNIALTPKLNLDLFATRSIGMRAGNTSTGGVSLRVAF